MIIILIIILLLVALTNPQSHSAPPSVRSLSKITIDYNLGTTGQRSNIYLQISRLWTCGTQTTQHFLLFYQYTIMEKPSLQLILQLCISLLVQGVTKPLPSALPRKHQPSRTFFTKTHAIKNLRKHSLYNQGVRYYEEWGPQN